MEIIHTIDINVLSKFSNLMLIDKVLSKVNFGFIPDAIGTNSV